MRLVWLPCIPPCFPLYLFVTFKAHSLCLTVLLSITTFFYVPLSLCLYLSIYLSLTQSHTRRHTHRRPVPTVAGAAERRVNLRRASPLFTCKKEVTRGFCYLKSHSLVVLKTTGLYPPFMI